ncbi:hypothetical protein F5Y04DRAFT_269505 [Hypomontagnella monticulosa]|nr:hypothetical protein F5Y04DRAFT_269505 [Hypomontagnella monticulosa]
MGDLRARIKAKLLRRHSAIPSLGSSKSLGRDRASSSTHTNTSTTGYAASVSTAASNGNNNNSNSHKGSTDRDRINADDTSGYEKVPFHGSPRNGTAVPVKSSQTGTQETVPPKLERLERLEQLQQLEEKLDLVDNSNVKFNGIPAILDGTVDTDADSDVDSALALGSTRHGHGLGLGLGNGATKVNNNLNLTPSSTSKTGKDLQNSSVINSQPAPTITTATVTSAATTTPTLCLDSNTIPNSIPNTTVAATATPLPCINENPTTTRTKAPTLDHHHRLHDSNKTIDTTDDDGCASDDHLRRPLSAGHSLSPSLSLSRPSGPPRRQSILPNRQTTLIKALLNTGYASDIASSEPDQLQPISGNMVTRKVWVKRPLASPTLITINEEDLVDDVRELILRKYANSLGRQYDAPDLTLRICDREQQTTRSLQPDEPMGRTLDAYYPGGQSVDDALLIDIPSRRTPKASPNPRFYDNDRPHESGTDYFPPYPPASQHASASSATAINGTHQLHFPPSLTILSGGQLPPLPSPGGTRRLASSRPKIQRMHTASPVSTVANSHTSQTVAPPTGMHNYPRQPRSRTHSGASSDQSNHPPAVPALPTPPAPERTATPPPRVSSPRPVNRPKKKKTIEHPSLPPGMLNGGVPPINVLIVEDNIINLRLLEAFVKRLKVRWRTAMNGREAVNKWRAGGFHLVLMDIQLPVMSGLEATREIRRIEKVNSIGVFSSSASSPPDEIKAEPAEEDKLVNTEMFKSPVIIVALTASSLQSDRHEALAAGCNDFLTKPVNFVWLERKVMEWGCMQALIDFDGWRKWKDFSQKAEQDDSKKAAAAKGTKIPKKNRLSTTTAAA